MQKLLKGVYKFVFHENEQNIYMYNIDMRVFYIFFNQLDILVYTLIAW